MSRRLLSIILVMLCLFWSSYAEEPWICPSCGMMVSGNFCYNCGKPKNDEGRANDTFELQINVEFTENLMFSRYDVEMCVDNEIIDVIPHGKDYYTILNLKRGQHTIEFYEHGDHSVKGIETVQLQDDSIYYCHIYTHYDEIDITDISMRDNNVTNRNGTSESKAQNGDPERIIMQVGSKGDDVVLLQSYLIKLGYLNGKADGDYGKKTADAVTRFQVGHGLEQNGCVTATLLKRIEQEVNQIPEINVVSSFTATELYEKYEDNEIAAKAELDDEIIEVSGTITNIGDDLWGNPKVSLGADSYGLTTIECYFSKEHLSELARLKKGRKIKVRGKCSGMSFLAVGVKDCEIIP